MSKGLEALKNIKREAETPYFSTLYDIDMWRDDFATIEKELNALEIIKNKECIFKGLSETTQEEYELLKEVLL